MIEELKGEIEKSFGRKIVSRGDCELLSDDLYRKTGVTISYNTLRRMFGLAEYRQPRITTLNHLSNYIGFKSFQDFNQRYAEVDIWPSWEQLYVAISTDDIHRTIEMLRYRQLNNLQFAISFTIVTRELLLSDNIEGLIELFRSPFFQFSQMTYDEVAQVGVLTGLLFRTYSNEESEKRLLKEPNFRDLILKIYVDYARLNGKYGTWIDWLLKFKGLDEETVTFIRCLSIWKRYLQSQPFLAKEMALLPDLKNEQHPILFGRLFGLKFLSADSANSRNSIIRRMKTRLKNFPESKSELLHEPAIQALVTRNKFLVRFVNEHLKDNAEISRWYHLSQISILNVFQVSVLISKKEYAKAQSILENIAIGHIRYGYREFIDLYISFFRMRISDAMEKDTTELYLDFCEKRKKMNYAIFTDEYFHSYFVISTT
jgi:hypothetical protein